MKQRRKIISRREDNVELRSSTLFRTLIIWFLEQARPGFLLFFFQSSPSGEYLKNTKAKLPTHKIDTLMSISLSDLCEMKETPMEKSVSNKYVNLPT